MEVKKVKKEIKEKKGLTAISYDATGKERGEILLNRKIFACKAKDALLAQAVRVHLTNQRSGTAKAKTRSEVSGSTRKIYRQKGTGRARHGSIKAPIFVGGGVVGGPKPKDYSKKLNKEQKKKAFFGVLTAKQEKNAIIVLAKGEEEKVQKTKQVAQFLAKIVPQAKRTLFVILKGKGRKLLQAGRNIENIEFVESELLNTYQVLKAEFLIFSEDALSQIK